MKNGICLECEKSFDKEKRKKFCSHLCSSRFNFRKRYKIMKDDDDYKEKAYQNTKKWVRNNRDRFNELCLAAYHRRKKLEAQNY